MVSGGVPVPKPDPTPVAGDCHLKRLSNCNRHHTIRCAGAQKAPAHRWGRGRSQTPTPRQPVTGRDHVGMGETGRNPLCGGNVRSGSGGCGQATPLRDLPACRTRPSAGHRCQGRERNQPGAVPFPALIPPEFLPQSPVFSRSTRDANGPVCYVPCVGKEDLPTQEPVESQTVRIGEGFMTNPTVLTGGLPVIRRTKRPHGSSPYGR